MLAVLLGPDRISALRFEFLSHDEDRLLQVNARGFDDGEQDILPCNA